MGAVQRIRVNSAAKLSFTLYDTDGNAQDADGAVTIEVTDAAGDTVVASTAATNEAAAGVYSYELAAQTQVAELTATWAGTIDSRAFEVETRHDVVGDVYFELAELRRESGLSDEAAFPDWLLEASRAATEDLFERATGTAWVNRYRRVTLDGNGKTRLALPDLFPQTLISLTIGGSAVASPEVALWDDGEIYYASGFDDGRRNIVMEYRHGLQRPPEDLRRAAIRYARVLTLDFKSRIPERAVQMSNEAGSFNLATASARRPTGYPDIDAVLALHDYRIPGIA